MTKYRHRQTGTTIIAALTPGVMLGLILFAILPAPEAYIGLGVACICLVFAVLFSSLSIEIAEGYLRWSFGPGVIFKRVSLADISDAIATQTSLLDGWGIHMTRRGWVYNVSGRRAVWITLRTGKKFILGSDEPERLVAVLRERRG